MNDMIQLTPVDLLLASTLILLLAGVSIALQLGVTRLVLIAACRTALQLSLMGLALKWLFANFSIGWFVLVSTLMLLAAGREVMARQKRPFLGLWTFGIGTSCMFISSFTIALLALTSVIHVEPWYDPRYSIPILGMLLGNTMNGISLGVDKLTTSASQQRKEIEARLLLGHTWMDAMKDIRRDCIRTGMIPIANAMAASGIISLPGMMTGQILAGASPADAVKYQILIMFLIAAGTGFGTIAAVWAGSKRLFDDRHRLRLGRLRAPKQ